MDQDKRGLGRAQNKRTEKLDLHLQVCLCVCVCVLRNMRLIKNLSKLAPCPETGHKKNLRQRIQSLVGDCQEVSDSGQLEADSTIVADPKDKPGTRWYRACACRICFMRKSTLKFSVHQRPQTIETNPDSNEQLSRPNRGSGFGFP